MTTDAVVALYIVNKTATHQNIGTYSKSVFHWADIYEEEIVQLF